VSPVDQSRNHVGRAGLVALLGVFVLVVGLGVAALAIGRRPSADLGLGDQTFQGGSTARLSAEIADRGPIFYGDVSGRKERDMVLQHLGPKANKGWYAFRAAPVDKPRSCTWQWQEKERTFRAKCDRSLTAPADGRGLPQFKVTISKGRIDVDLNARPTSTTTKSKPTSASTTAAPLTGGG